MPMKNAAVLLAASAALALIVAQPLLAQSGTGTPSGSGASTSSAAPNTSAPITAAPSTSAPSTAPNAGTTSAAPSTRSGANMGVGGTDRAAIQDGARGERSGAMRGNRMGNSTRNSGGASAADSGDRMSGSVRMSDGRRWGGGDRAHRRGHWRGARSGYYGGFGVGVGVGSSYGYGYDDYAYRPYGYGSWDDEDTFTYGVQSQFGSGGGVQYCMQRYRSYDPRSGTYLGFDGERHPCP